MLQAWKGFFGQRWLAVDLRAACTPEGEQQQHRQTWQARYGRKMRAQRCFSGRARQDAFFGHRGGVRCIALLPACNLMATGAWGTPPPLGWMIPAPLGCIGSLCSAWCPRMLHPGGQPFPLRQGTPDAQARWTAQ